MLARDILTFSNNVGSWTVVNNPGRSEAYDVADNWSHWEVSNLSALVTLAGEHLLKWTKVWWWAFRQPSYHRQSCCLPRTTEKLLNQEFHHLNGMPPLALHHKGFPAGAENVNKNAFYHVKSMW